MNRSDTAESVDSPDPKHFLYPPGGILLWMLISLELFTFGAAIVVMMFSAHHEPSLFHASAAKLDAIKGSVNTVVLLTSGYFMALCVHNFRHGKTAASHRFLGLTLAAGLVFITIKSFEYSHKIAEGYTIGTNTFFDFYWFLTGFHLAHVIAGMVILLGWYITHRRSEHASALDGLEASAAFWHMCDLIWLFLFPVLYLIF